MGCLDGVPAFLGVASVGLNAMAIRRSWSRGPLVTLVWCLTVAKVSWMGLGRP